MRPYLEKKLSQKRAGRVAEGVGPEFKPQYHKKEKKKELCHLLRALFSSPCT
jgi:hypothetical protein